MHVPVFMSLIVKIIPLYLNIMMGFIAGKKLQACRETIARIIFFMITPIIIFNAALNVPLKANVLTLPLLTCAICCSLCLLFYRISLLVWEDSTKNLMAFSAGTGNAGYFGLPVALLLFSADVEGLYIFLLLGMTLYENTLGYYILARGQNTAKDCFFKLFKLPALYAFSTGLLLNGLSVPIPEVFEDFMNHIKGTYTVLGMMMVGLGLSSLDRLKIDEKYLSLTLIAKFLAWPLAALTINYLDQNFFGIYTHDIHQALLLLSVVPVGVNTVILATMLRSKPEKASVAVIVSTILAIIYVPLMVSLFIQKSSLG